MENRAEKPKMIYLDGETTSAISFVEQMTNSFDIIQTNNTKKVNNILSMLTPDVILLNLCGHKIDKGIEFIEATAAQLMPKKVVFGMIVGDINEEILEKANLHQNTLVFTPISSKKSILNAIQAELNNESFRDETVVKKKIALQNPNLV
jgi:chemotaxis response regulator CheB